MALINSKKLKDLQAENEELISTLQRINDKEDKLIRLEELIKKVYTEISELNRQKTDYTTSIDQLKSEETVLNDELEKLHLEIDKLREMKSDEQHNLLFLTNQINDVKPSMANYWANPWRYRINRAAREMTPDLLKNQNTEVEKIRPQTETELRQEARRVGNPYKPHNDKYRCIFTHIPKAAGISLESALFSEKVGHKRILHYALYDGRRFKDYFKFTFVRNPFDRVVSAFFFLKKGGRNRFDEQWAQRNLSSFNDIDEFVYALENKTFATSILSWQHFSPQYPYVTDLNGRILVDFIGKVETIEADFQYVCSQLNVRAALAHHNRSHHKNFRAYFNDRMYEIIYNLYKMDFLLFDYDIESSTRPPKDVTPLSIWKRPNICLY